MARYASIDVGTNTVLMLVAERSADAWQPIVEREAITRLGRGVDRTRHLAVESIDATVNALTTFAAEARALGAAQIVTTATSAARDATNGAVFLAAARARAGLEIEILAGDEEARLSFAAAWADFGGDQPLIVLDIGAGSTEVIYGRGATLDFRRSFSLGSVRLFERFGSDLGALRGQVRGAFSPLPAPPPGARFVAVAGTATSLSGVCRGRVDVHGDVMTREEVIETVARLLSLSLEERTRLPGLSPQRADVILAGAIIFDEAMRSFGATEVTISDRGLRWGLLSDRFRDAP